MKTSLGVLVLSAPVVALMCACTHRVVIAEPVKIEITARVDIYQHAETIEDMVSGEEPIPEVSREGDTAETSSRLMDLLVWRAYAAGPETRKVPELKITLEVAKRIKDRKERHGEIEAAKQDGVVGENNRGLLDERPSRRMEKDAEYRKKIQDLVKAENGDREFIYREIARQQKMPEDKIDEIRFIFAEVHRVKAKPGEWIQLPDDGKELERFEQSLLGRLLGRKLQPGEWVKKAE